MTIGKIQRLTLAGLLLMAALTLFTPSTAAQDPAPADTATRVDPRFGVVDAFANTAEANEAGAGWTRIFLRWDVVQPAGPSDWKPANVSDTLLEAEIAAGREITAVLIGTPAWATENQVSTAVPPLEYWGDFVFKIATQYKGRINHWVIWNQPDITDPASPNYTWAGSEADYAALLKEAYTKIKAVDPAMQVHLAGLTYTWDRDRGQTQYLARLLDIIIADPDASNQDYFFDAASYHVYYDPRQMLEILTDVRSILDAHGLGQKPVWINETNAPPSEDFLEPLAGPAAYNITLEEQSAYVIQAVSLALAGGAERIAINRLRNERNDPEAIEPFGLLRGDNSRRPAFNAFRTVTAHFTGVQNTAWVQMGHNYIVTLDRAGQTTTVLWNVERTPTTFPLNAIAPQALLVDDQGNEQLISAANSVYTIELPGAVCSNGDVCFIGGAPRLIIEAGSPDQRASLLPLLSPTPTSTPPADTPAPTDSPLPPPTLTPLPKAAAPLAADSNNDEAAPEPEAVAQALPAFDEDVLPEQDSGPPPAAALPAPGIGDSENDPAAESSVTTAPTRVPPVTIATVLNPRRILWLLIIGLIVFTVSYGVQVAIWYRLKR